MKRINSLKSQVPYSLVCWIAFAFLISLPIASSVEAQGQEPLLTLSTSYEFTHVAWSPDQDLIAVGKNDGTVIYDSNLQEVAHMSGDGIVGLSWNPEGTQLATGGGFYAKRGEVQIWKRDLISNTFNLLKAFHNSHEGMFSVAWSPDGKMLATTSRDTWEGLEPIIFTIEIWNADIWTLKTTLKHQYIDGYINLSWSSDSTELRVEALNTDVSQLIVCRINQGFTSPMWKRVSAYSFLATIILPP